MKQADGRLMYIHGGGPSAEIFNPRLIPPLVSKRQQGFDLKIIL